MQNDYLLSEEQIQTFQTQGVICLRNCIREKELNLLTEGIEFNLKNLSARAKVASTENDPGLFIEDFCTWQDNPFYKEFIFQSPLSCIAGKLMQSKTVRLYHDHLLVKEKETKQHTPWHQDQPYYNITGQQNCSFWIPVDPVPRSASLEFIPGSHLGPWLMPRTFIDNQAKWFPEGSLADLPNIEHNRANFPIISWEINPGDIVCFHMLTLHAAAGSKERRRVFSVRFLGDDIRHAPRPWKTSPEFPNLANELPINSPMHHPLFPLIWQDNLSAQIKL